jgi:hypothetical protein
VGPDRQRGAGARERERSRLASGAERSVRERESGRVWRAR